MRFMFNGHALEANEGQSVGAALLAAGYRETRITRFGEQSRGMFCGIGVCFDCLITIDGRTNQRACVIEVREGMLVITQEGSGVIGDEA